MYVNDNIFKNYSVIYTILQITQYNTLYKFDNCDSIFIY